MSSFFAHMSDGVSATISVPDVSINWLAILAATVAAMIIGSVWYGPFFGKRWMKLVGINKKDAQKDWKAPMLTMLIMAFVQAYILRHFIVYTAYFYPDMSVLSIGLIVAFWAWVGLVLPLVLSSNMFARRPMDLTKLEAGNQLVTLLAIGAILAIWN